jgi:hypothetical protein
MIVFVSRRNCLVVSIQGDVTYGYSLVSWKGLVAEPVTIMYDSINILSVLEISLLSRMWATRKEMCARPCSTARSYKPIPPKRLVRRRSSEGCVY